MMRRTHKRNSIMYKMTVTVMAVLLLQSLLLLGALAVGGTVYQLNRNALDILNERTINRKNYLENEMAGRWSQVTPAVQEMQSIEEDLEKKFHASTGELALKPKARMEFLQSAAQPLIQMLRRQSVSGTFLVLGAKAEEPHNPGLYFRDFDPKSNSGDNSDLLLERGPSQIGKAFDVPLGARWEGGFSLSGTPGQGESFDYFLRPLEAAAEYPGEDPQNLGYWSRPFHMPLDSTEIITYSVPLISGSGQVFGVLGVEISLPYLNTLLPYQEIGTKHNSAYLLGISHGAGEQFEPVALNGPLFKQLADGSQPIVFENESAVKNVYLLKGKEGIEPSYASVQTLNLYNSNTPFVNDQWALVGLDVKSSLLAFTNKMLILLAAAWAVSLVVGLLFAYVASHLLTRPVQSLVDKVLRSNPNEPVKFEKTHISEVDDLAASIEVLSQRVAASASKLSRVIQMASVPIGAFEYELGADTVACTDRLFQILSDGSLPTPPQGNAIPVKTFKAYMNNALRYKEESSESGVVFRLHDEEGFHKWVRLKLISEQGKKLGVVEDITAQVKEKRKIEYERDYDLLTNLLNRRAFQSQLKALWDTPEQLKIAALVMLDLDNLKYINDTFGHDYGDQYIRCTAHILTRYVPQPALVSRMSGDEFYILYYGYETKQEIREQLKILEDGFQEKIFRLPGEEQPMRVRASAGVAWYPEDSEESGDLIRYADFAMYTVKKTVKGAFQEFDKAAYLRDAYLLEERENINRFIEEELVEYYFQPIVSAKNGDVLGYEALMRPQMKGLRSPTDVLMLARSQSKLYQIEKLTLFHSLKAFRRQKHLPDGCKVFVNSVANQCLSETDLREFERTFPDLLHAMVVELTEEEKTDTDCLQVKRDCARRWGCQFALDDFGEGYNGEGILLKLSPDYIKLDRGLIKNVDMDADRRQLVQNLVLYARHRGIKVVAEGVETPRELQALVRLGVDYLQGYYIGMPAVAAQAIQESVREEIILAAHHKNDAEQF